MKYTCVVCVCCIIVNFETSWKMFSQKGEYVMGSNFEITFISEKHMVEDDVLFTNHLVGKQEIPMEVMECCCSAWGGHGSSWL